MGAYLSGDGGAGCDELEDGFLSDVAAGAKGLLCVEVGILGCGWDMVVCVEAGIIRSDVDGIPASTGSAFRGCDSGIVARPWASRNTKTMHVDITRTSEHLDHVSTKMGVPLNFDADRKL